MMTHNQSTPSPDEDSRTRSKRHDPIHIFSDRNRATDDHYIVLLVYLIADDCCAVYCSESELSERVNFPKAILTARSRGMCEPELRW